MPRRRPGWLPKLSHHAPRQCGRVRIPGQGIVYLGKSGCWTNPRKDPPAEVVEEYERELARWKQQQQDGPPPTRLGEHCTIGELAASYLLYADRAFRKRGKPTSNVSLMRRALEILMRFYGTLPAEQFRAAELRTIRDALEREGKLCRASINSTLGRIRLVFKWGSGERDLFPEEVWLRLRSVAGLQRQRSQARESPGERPADLALVEQTLPHLPAVIADMVRLQMATGMRGLEICWMRANEIHEEPDGLWRYVASDAGNKLAHKGITKIVYLGPRAQAILLPRLIEARRRAPDAYLFPKRHGQGNIRPVRYVDVIRETCDAQGIPRWRPRQLRHLKGTEIRRVYGLEGTQAQLGHLSSTTSTIYSTQALEDLARRIARETG